MTSQLKKHQRGAVSAIMVYVLLAIVGGMLIASQLMSGASLSGNNQKSDHLQALFLAESALEREIAALNADATICNASSLPVNLQNFAGGTFETISANIVTTNMECIVKVKGIKNSVVTVIEATLENQGGIGGGGGGGSYEEHFPSGSLATWPATETSSEGSSSLDAGENCTTCAGTPSGQALYFITATGGGWNNLIGYRQEQLMTAIDTTGGGVTVDFSLGYKKNVIGSTGGVKQRIYLELYDSTNGVSEVIWQNISTIDTNVWIPVSQTSVALNNGRIYDYVRISYNIKGKAGREPEVWMDEINISSGGGGGASPDWQTIKWDEVNQ